VHIDFEENQIRKKQAEEPAFFMLECVEIT